ncbi:UNVERIFIED_CONTAM: hypothetical protein Sindi_0736000 [Sesamum indicum]
MHRAERRVGLQGVAIARHAPRGAWCIKRILGQLEQASGLKINLNKWVMVFSRNVPQAHHTSLATILGDEGANVETFARLGNEAADLSRADGPHQDGPAALPTYMMGCFELLSSIIKEMEGMMDNFFWYGGGEGTVHWIAWDCLCHRMKEGGLGFRRMREYNIAILAKLAWCVVTQPNNILHQVLRHRYFPNATFFEARPGGSPFLTWRSYFEQGIY